MLTAGGAHRQRGFTLIELMITVSILALLVLVAAPSLRTWIFNTRVRTTAESLQNGLRLAQAEAVRQSRQVLFGLTAAAPALDVTTVANGANWTAQTVPVAYEGTSGRFVRGGPLGDVRAGVVVSGPRAICFNSIGATTTNAAPGPAAVGTCTAGATAYAISHPNADRCLQVQVALGGRVRMCDPFKSLSAANPDGCAATVATSPCAVP